MSGTTGSAPLKAVRQFEIFTGESAPKAVMERAAAEALASALTATKNDTVKSDTTKPDHGR